MDLYGKENYIWPQTIWIITLKYMCLSPAYESAGYSGVKIFYVCSCDNLWISVLMCDYPKGWKVPLVNADLLLKNC